MNVWVVQRWPNGVLTSTRVHVHVDFLGGDGGRLGSQLVHLVLVAIGEVLMSRLVQVGRVAHELQARHVVARVRVRQVRRRLVDAGAGGCWAEARDLYGEEEGKQVEQE